MKIDRAFKVCFFAIVSFSVGFAGPPSLKVLRKNLARKFMDPRAHMRFAKALVAHGREASAFSVMEYARRVVFSRKRKAFRWAHREVFFEEEPFDNSPEAERRLFAKLKKKPRDPKLLFKIADIYISRKEWEEAEAWLKKLIEIDPKESLGSVRALREVLSRQGRKEEGDAVLERWMAAHKDSADAMIYRAEKLPRDSPLRVKLLEEALAKHPGNGWVHFYLAMAVQGKDPDRAEKLYTKAAELEPKEPAIQGWTGRFLLRARKKPDKALKYYYKAYFLDPDFYDTEYAEYRVRKLARDQAARWVRKRKADGWSLERMVEEGNAFQVLVAVTDAWKRKVPEDPKPGEVDLMARLLGHDAPMVQVMAVQAFLRWDGDLARKKVKELLKDKDPFRKSLALLPAIKHLGEEGLMAAGKRLRSKWDLFWYDALTGLAQLGGQEWRKILEEHMKGEKRPVVLELWQRISRK